MPTISSIFTGIAWVFAALALVGSAYQLLAIWAIRRLASQQRPMPSSFPPVTILKPLCGSEPGLYENLLSFCTQDYPAVELVCGVRDATDPAIEIVRRLQADLPAARIRLVIDPALHGANNKISNLINMMADVTHEKLVLSDSDMRVGPDYLKAVVGALETTGAGIATCLYTGTPLPGPWSVISAAGINYWFLPSAALSKLLGGKIGCYGATIAIDRATLESVGGFAALRDQLADDYALGALVRASGKSIVVVPYFPATLVNEPSVRAFVRHELRWARTIRNTAPIGFAGSAITHPVPMALLAAGFGAVAGAPWQMVSVVFASAVASRVFLVAGVSRLFDVSLPAWWLLMARDVLSLVFIVAAFCGRSVSWRERAFRFDSLGALSPERHGSEI